MSTRLRSCLPHLVILLIAITLWVVAMDIDAPPGRIGPDVWPKAVIVLMGLLGVVEIGRRLVAKPAPAAARPAEPPPAADPQATQAAQTADLAELDNPADGPLNLTMLLGGGAMIGGYVLAVSWLGFFLTTFLFLCGFAWVGGFRRLGWVLGLGLAGSVLSLVLFMRVAYISLPLGEGPFRSLSLAMLRLIGVS